MLLIAPDELVGLDRRAQAVEPHGAVVLVARRVAGVPEAVAARRPRQRAGPAVGDLLGEVLAAVRVDDAQHARLGTPFGQPDGDQRPVTRGVVPVDRHRRIGGAGGRIDERARRGVRVGERPHDEGELFGPRRPVEAEQAVAAHRGGRRLRQLHQRDEALVPPAAVGPGIERLTGTPVLGLDPGDRLGGVAVLQPPVRVGDRHAVEDVDDVVPARRRNVADQPRPMFGRLPWFAFERRSFALRFFVFFDIGSRCYRRGPAGHPSGPPIAGGQRSPASQSSREASSQSSGP